MEGKGEGSVRRGGESKKEEFAARMKKKKNLGKVLNLVHRLIF